MEHAGTVYTSKMQLWSIEEEDGQGLDQVRPSRVVIVYRLVVREAGPPLTVKVDVTGIRYQAH